MILHVNHPEDERFDKINITVVPRWKESELSGDEWRFSYVAEAMRKGEVIVTISASKLEWLLAGLQWRLMISGEEGNFDQEAFARTKDKCDQPGCKKTATIFVKRINMYTDQGQKLDSSERSETYRQYCEGHKVRGDCDLDDADQNYIEISDPKGE